MPHNLPNVSEMLTLSSWETPASSYPPGPVGRARIRTIRYRGVYHAYGLKGHRYYQTTGIEVRGLHIGRKVWMVDDPAHWWAMQDHATYYSGHVLCAGLGLGLIVHTLNENPRVNRITVVEREADVIDLIAPNLPSQKLTIIHGDFWNHRELCDGVLFDLFVGAPNHLLALRTYIQLLERFPRPIRIHGFQNEYFDRLGQQIEQGEAATGRPRFDGRRLLRHCGS